MKIPFPLNQLRRHRSAAALKLLSLLLLSVALLCHSIAPARAQLPLEIPVFENAMRGGVNTATGSINSDGVPDIIVASKSGMPRVRVFDGRSGALIREFLAYDAPAPGGVQVAVAVNGTTFENSGPVIVTAPGVGSEAIVKVFDANSGLEIRRFPVIGADFRGGVRIATLNVNGIVLVAVVPETNAPPIVRLYRVADGTLFSQFFAFDPGFTGGLTVATEAYQPNNNAVNSDGAIVVGAGPGGLPVVRVFGAQGDQIGGEILAFDANFRGGVRVALQRTFSFNSGSRVNIVVAAGPGGLPLVRVFDRNTRRLVRNFVVGDPNSLGGLELSARDATSIFNNGTSINLPPTIFVTGGANSLPIVQVYDGRLSLPNSFLAFDAGFLGGVRVALGDVNGDGSPDAVVGAGEGGLPIVVTFDGRTGLPSGAFFAFDVMFRGGVTVAVGDTDGDGRENIVIGAGRGGLPIVGVFTETGALQSAFLAFDAPFGGGINVAAGAYPDEPNAVVVAAPLSQGFPEVRVFQPNGAFLQAATVYDASYRNGINIAYSRASPVLVVAPSGGAALPVRVFIPVSADRMLRLRGEFFPYGEFFEGGISVAVSSFADSFGSATVLTAPQGGTRPLVKRFAGDNFTNFTQVTSYQTFDPAFRGPVYLAVMDSLSSFGNYNFLISAGSGVPVVQQVVP